MNNTFLHQLVHHLHPLQLILYLEALGEQLQAAVDRSEPDDGSRYFEHWVAALELLLADKNLTDSAALRERKEAWVEAYLHTPHGQPVELGERFR